jgi:hypothetical protein
MNNLIGYRHQVPVPVFISEKKNKIYTSSFTIPVFTQIFIHNTNEIKFMDTFYCWTIFCPTVRQLRQLS